MFNHLQLPNTSILLTSHQPQLLPYLPTSHKWQLWQQRLQRPDIIRYGQAIERQQRLPQLQQLTQLVKIHTLILRRQLLRLVWIRLLLEESILEESILEESNRISYIHITWQQ